MTTCKSIPHVFPHFLFLPPLPCVRTLSVKNPLSRAALAVVRVQSLLRAVVALPFAMAAWAFRSWQAMFATQRCEGRVCEGRACGDVGLTKSLWDVKGRGRMTAGLQPYRY